MTPTQAAAALDLPAGVTATVTGSSTVETRPFNDFPSDPAKGSDYLVLSTGLAEDVMLDAPLAIDDPRTPVFEREPDPLVSTDREADRLPDTTTLTITVAPSTGAGCLQVDFAMATDETVRAYLPGTPGDSFSVTRRSDPETEHAMNAGEGYFQQDGWTPEPRPYGTNDVDYWHEPGDRTDVENGQLETPRLARWTPLSRVTTRDTAAVPLNLAGGPEVIDVVVSDALHDAGELDTAAFVDNVGLTDTCAAGVAARPAHQYGEGSIKGERRVGYPLSYDPVPSTSVIERYDAVDNGWTHLRPPHQWTCGSAGTGPFRAMPTTRT
ncbi:hypothetical protein [Nocardioides sp. TF02-7]|uniref:hypothetical protein n=1 Tax=Nocardioides sp. TF02-7 TaxID=2917724 RepID=UPI001F05DD31|nr:hypothetical protein [Nocardioides sp. TF02-7]UMG92047.1 hypothetical protein MF408_19040 [Nocardioides sp. TF02-7]